MANARMADDECFSLSIPPNSSFELFQKNFTPKEFAIRTSAIRHRSSAIRTSAICISRPSPSKSAAAGTERIFGDKNIGHAFQSLSCVQACHSLYWYAMNNGEIADEDSAYTHHGRFLLICLQRLWRYR